MPFWSRKQSDPPAGTLTSQPALPEPPTVTETSQDDWANKPPVPSSNSVPPSIPTAATQTNIDEVTRTHHWPEISSAYSLPAVPLRVPSPPKLRDVGTSQDRPILTVPQKSLSQITSEQSLEGKDSGQHGLSSPLGGESDDEQFHDASAEDDKNDIEAHNAGKLALPPGRHLTRALSFETAERVTSNTLSSPPTTSTRPRSSTQPQGLTRPRREMLEVPKLRTPQIFVGNPTIGKGSQTDSDDVGNYVLVKDIQFNDTSGPGLGIPQARNTAASLPITDEPNCIEGAETVSRNSSPAASPRTTKVIPPPPPPKPAMLWSENGINGGHPGTARRVSDGEVYEKIAHDGSADLFKVFAKKIVRASGTTPREADVIGALPSDGHPNLVNILTAGWNHWQGQRQFCIEMEWCEFNLHDYIYGQYKTPQSKNFVDLSLPAGYTSIWDVLEQITCGVAFMHQLKLVHRDLKPSNVLYSTATGHWKLTDFGFTMTCALNEIKPCELGLGSPGYRAPELVRDIKTFSPAVDVWAIGCILFEIWKTKQAFDDDYAVHYYATSNFGLDALFAFDNDDDPDLRRVLIQTLNVEIRNRPSSTNLRQQISGKLWRSIGDDLQSRQLYASAIKAYERGISETGVESDPINGPLVEGIRKAIQGENNAEVYPSDDPLLIKMSQELEERNQEMANMKIVQNELRQELDLAVWELKKTRDLNHDYQYKNAKLQQTVDELETELRENRKAHTIEMFNLDEKAEEKLKSLRQTLVNAHELELNHLKSNQKEDLDKWRERVENLDRKLHDSKTLHTMELETLGRKQKADVSNVVQQWTERLDASIVEKQKAVEEAVKSATTKLQNDHNLQILSMQSEVEKMKTSLATHAATIKTLRLSHAQNGSSKTGAVGLEDAKKSSESEQQFLKEKKTLIDFYERKIADLLSSRSKELSNSQSTPEATGSNVPVSKDGPDFVGFTASPTPPVQDSHDPHLDTETQLKRITALEERLRSNLANRFVELADLRKQILDHKAQRNSIKSEVKEIQQQKIVGLTTEHEANLERIGKFRKEAHDRTETYHRKWNEAYQLAYETYFNKKVQAGEIDAKRIEQLFYAEPNIGKSTREYHEQLAKLRAEETTLRGQELTSIQLHATQLSQLQNEFVDRLCRARLADYDQRFRRVLDRISAYETEFGVRDQDQEIPDPATNGQ